MSVIIVLCRVWDAVNDPMMGTIISNTRTRFGKYRPWVLIGCIANLIFFIGLFTIRIDVGSNIDTLGWWNVAILGICYLLWGMSFTMNDVSYWSLLPVLSEDKKERDTLTTMVSIFASVGSFVAGGVIPAQDYDFLFKSGAAAVFGPGTVISDAATKMLELLIAARQ